MHVALKYLLSLDYNFVRQLKMNSMLDNSILGRIYVLMIQDLLCERERNIFCYYVIANKTTSIVSRIVISKCHMHLKTNSISVTGGRQVTQRNSILRLQAGLVEYMLLLLTVNANLQHSFGNVTHKRLSFMH